MKKPWFLKRWTYKLLTWLDEILFGRSATQDILSVAQPFWITVIINFWLGMIIIICSFFADSGVKDQLMTIGAGIGLASIIAITAWYLIGTLKYFQSVSIKILRSIYVLILCILGFVVGFYSAVIFTFILIGILVLMLVYYMVFGESRDKNPRIKLEDDTELNQERGMTGEEYYTDDSGHSYDRSGDTFTRK